MIEQIQYQELRVGDAFVRGHTSGHGIVVFVESIAPDPEDKDRLLIVGIVFGSKEKCATKFKKTAKIVRVSKATQSVLGSAQSHEPNNTSNN